MKAHHQNVYSIFTGARIIFIMSATIKGALIRFEKKYKQKPDAVYLGRLSY